MKQFVIRNLDRYRRQSKNPAGPAELKSLYIPKSGGAAIVEVPLADDSYTPVAVLLGKLRIPVSCSPELDETTYHVALPPAPDLPGCVSVEYRNADKIDFQVPDAMRKQCPGSLRDLVDMARRLESENKLPKALACVNTILAIDPDNFEGNFRKGRILEKQNLNEAARVYSLRAFEVRPRHYRPATTLGRIAMKEKRFDLAIHYYRLVSDRCDTYVEACTSIAKALSNLDRTFEAIEYYEKAVAHCPDKLSYRRDAARLMAKTGLLDEAIEIYEKLSVIEGTNITRELNDAYRSRMLSKDTPPAIRYRGAFSAERDICICCGPDENIIAFAQATAERISQQTGCSVDIMHSGLNVVPAPVSVSRKQYECCLILPPALLDPNFRAPSAILKFSYLDDNQMESIDESASYQRYETWVNGIVNLY